VLTLSKDSNQILKMLYGEINVVVKNGPEEVVVPETSQVEGVSRTVPYMEEVVVEEVEEVEQPEEFEVKIQ
jgi:hypothetical protein